MLSVIIPCFNEEKLVKSSVLETLKAIKLSKINKYEIIFIDDGSEDRSCLIVESLRKKNKNIKIIKNKKNFGIGYNFFKGVRKSKGKHLIQIPSDNSHASSEISKILKLINRKYDLVTTYYTNNAGRSLFRRLFTSTYTPLLNLIYGTNFTYFNGLTIYKTRDLKKLKIKNYSFSYQIEIFVYLFYKHKLKIKFVPTIVKDRIKGSNAFKLKNSFLVAVSIVRIFGKSVFYRYLNFFNK